MVWRENLLLPNKVELKTRIATEAEAMFMQATHTELPKLTGLKLIDLKVKSETWEINWPKSSKELGPSRKRYQEDQLAK